VDSSEEKRGLDEGELAETERRARRRKTHPSANNQVVLSRLLIAVIRQLRLFRKTQKRRERKEKRTPNVNPMPPNPLQPTLLLFRPRVEVIPRSSWPVAGPLRRDVVADAVDGDGTAGAGVVLFLPQLSSVWKLVERRGGRRR
jgi:hypothetical protein